MRAEDQAGKSLIQVMTIEIVGEYSLDPKNIVYYDTEDPDEFENQTGSFYYILSDESEKDNYFFTIDGEECSLTIGETAYTEKYEGFYGTFYITPTGFNTEEKRLYCHFVYVPSEDYNIYRDTKSETIPIKLQHLKDSILTTLIDEAIVITINGVNDAPKLNGPITLAEYNDTIAYDIFINQTGNLQATDVDEGDTLSYGINDNSSPSDKINYDIMSLGSFGTLYVNSSTGDYMYVPDNDAINGLIYTYNTYYDSFSVYVVDKGESRDGTFVYIYITPENDLPEVKVNNGLTIGKGERATITNEHLLTTDIDGVEYSQDEAMYKIVSFPEHGYIYINGEKYDSSYPEIIQFPISFIDNEVIEYEVVIPVAGTADTVTATVSGSLIRALGLAAGTGGSSFTDVRSSDWFCGAVETAARYGLILGYDDGTFRPNDKITREQALVIISRAMKLAKIEPNLTGEKVTSLLSAFLDDTSISGWAKDGIASLLVTGVIAQNDGALKPAEYITRAEVAFYIYRMLDKADLI